MTEAAESRVSHLEGANPLMTWLQGRVLWKRVVAGLLVGNVAMFLAWALGYWLLPPGVLRGKTGAGMIQNVLGLGTLWMALIWNFLLAFVVIPALSILAVGRLSLGYVVAIGNYALFGIFLGTSSFTVVRSGPSLPSLSVYGGTGPWEIAAYVLVAAAVANRYRFRQESWLRTATDRISEPPERLSTRHWATLGMALTLIVVTAIAEGT